MDRPMEPTEILDLMRPVVRAGVGMLVWALADRLAVMTEEELAAFGLVVAGDATGWMGLDELSVDRIKGASRDEIDFLADELLRRVQAAGLWEQQLADDEPDDTPR